LVLPPRPAPPVLRLPLPRRCLPAPVEAQSCLPRACALLLLLLLLLAHLS
jgi:hypothetical protein